MSYPSTYTYETVYILKPHMTEKDADAVHSKVDSVISKFKGSLAQRDDWGVKDMAYEIDGHRQGRYCVIHYSGQSGVVPEIERHFKISSDVIRYITVAIESPAGYMNLKKQIAIAEEERKARKEKKRQFDGPARG